VKPYAVVQSPVGIVHVPAVTLGIQGHSQLVKTMKLVEDVKDYHVVLLESGDGHPRRFVAQSRCRDLINMREQPGYEISVSDGKWKEEADFTVVSVLPEFVTVVARPPLVWRLVLATAPVKPFDLILDLIKSRGFSHVSLFAAELL
jgi:hypothetical protein